MAFHSIPSSASHTSGKLLPSRCILYHLQPPVASQLRASRLVGFTQMHSCRTASKLWAIIWQ